MTIDTRIADTDAVAPMLMTLVTGFLGAGKTSWLERQSRRGAPWEHLIVNDVGALIPELAQLPAAVEIANGCLCCTGANSFRAALRQLVADKHCGVSGGGGLVVETSGLADPNAVVALLNNDPMLSVNIELSEIVVVVDAVFGLSQLRHEPLASVQLDAAHGVVVTKTDLMTREQALTVVGALSSLAPSARIECDPDPHSLGPVAVEHGTALRAEDLAVGAVVEGCRATAGAQAAPEVITIRLSKDTDWAVLATWLGLLLNVHGENILRLKGRVPSGAGPLIIDAVHGVMHPPRPAPSDGPYAIVLVVRHLDRAAVERSWRDLQESCQPLR